MTNRKAGDQLIVALDVPTTLEAAGIVVERMRNKVNRLEELFVKMTSKPEKRGLL